MITPMTTRKPIISQDAIDDVLSVISDEEFVSFCKEYLSTHPEMFTSLKERFIPSPKKESTSFNYKKEVDACFRHLLKTPRWERNWNYEPDYLDWEKVGKDLRRVIKRAETYIEAGNPDTAINTALYILKVVDRQFEEEFLGEREDWMPDDLCIEECITLIKVAFESPLVPKERKLVVCDELEGYEHSEFIDYVSDSGLKNLIKTTRATLLTDEEQLDILKRNFKKESSSWNKEEFACEIWNRLKNSGKIDDAVAFFNENKDIDKLRRKYFNLLISEGKTQQALDVIDEGIQIARKRYHHATVSDWMLCKVSLYESMNDTKNVLAVYRELFRESNDSDTIKYYRKIKGLVPEAKWQKYRDELLKVRNFGKTANNVLAVIYVEEQLLDRLYEHLLHSNYALLSALESYAKYLSEEQQQILVARLEKELCGEFSFNTTRKDYQNLAGRLSRLKKTCPAGKAMAEKVINYHLTKYRNRPALREELQKVR